MVFNSRDAFKKAISKPLSLYPFCITIVLKMATIKHITTQPERMLKRQYRNMQNILLSVFEAIVFPLVLKSLHDVIVMLRA